MARSDAFQQYAQGGQEKADPLAEIARAKGQYTASQPSFTEARPGYQWGGHPIKPQAAKHFAFPYPSVATSSGEGGAAEPPTWKKKRERNKVEEAPGRPDGGGDNGGTPSGAPTGNGGPGGGAAGGQAPSSPWPRGSGGRAGYSPWGTQGSTRDFNDSPMEQTVGASVGNPVTVSKTPTPI